MMTETIKQCVVRLIERKAKLPKMADIDVFNYIDSGHIDSIGIVKFVLEIESHFAVEISESDMESAEFRTVGGVVAIIQRAVKTDQSRP